MRGLALIAALVLAAFSLPYATAKEEKPSRTVKGIVSDQADNPIVGAVVLLTDPRTGKKSATYTGTEGAYQYSGLELSRDYEVQASHNGVSSRVRKISSVDPRNRIVINLRIPPSKEEEQ